MHVTLFLLTSSVVVAFSVVRQGHSHIVHCMHTHTHTHKLKTELICTSTSSRCQTMPDADQSNSLINSVYRGFYSEQLKSAWIPSHLCITPILLSMTYSHTQICGWRQKKYSLCALFINSNGIFNLAVTALPIQKSMPYPNIHCSLKNHSYCSLSATKTQLLLKESHIYYATSTNSNTITIHSICLHF